MAKKNIGRKKYGKIDHKQMRKKFVLGRIRTCNEIPFWNFSSAIELQAKKKK